MKRNPALDTKPAKQLAKGLPKNKREKNLARAQLEKRENHE